MATDSTGYLQIPALGRPVQLGQAYSAITGNLINNILFDPGTVAEATKTLDASHYEQDTQITESTKERTDFLKIDLSITANILSGAMQVKGSANYLDQRNVKENGTTIAFRVAIHDRQERIDLNIEQIRLNGLNANAEELKNMGATHVVASIIYGGTIVASATEMRSDEKSSNEIKGELTVKIKNAFDILGTGEGNGKLRMETAEELNKYDLELHIMGDSVISDAVPTTISTLVEYLSQAKKKLPADKLIPVQIQLVPLAGRFPQASALSFFKDLEDQALNDLIRFYDDLVSITQAQATLTRDVQTATFIEPPNQPQPAEPTGGEAVDETGAKVEIRSFKSKYFPSFVRLCTEWDRDAQLLIVEVRNNMGKYLRAKRENPNTITEDFDAYPFVHPLSNVNGMKIHIPPNKAADCTIRQAFNECKKAVTENQAAWLKYQQRLENKTYWPYLTVDESFDKMDIGETGTSGYDILAITLVPDNYASYNLTQIYDFKKDIPGRFPGKRIGYYSVYPDELLDDDFKLAGMAGSSSSITPDITQNYLMEAIISARTKSQPVLLFLTRSHEGQGAVQWQVPSAKGWGLIVDSTATTRYTGEIVNDKPHGYGKREYPDGTRYEGNWVQGVRSGYGNFIGLTESAARGPSQGLYMDGKPAVNGVAVDITLYDDEGYPARRAQTALPSPSQLNPEAWETVLDMQAGLWKLCPELTSYLNDQIRRIATALGMLTNEPLSNCLIVQSEEGYYPRDPTASFPKGFAIICDENGNCLSYYKALAMTLDEMQLFDWLGRRFSGFQPVYEMQHISIWRRQKPAPLTI